MKYPTAEETRAVLNHDDAYICTCFDDNPNVEGIKELYTHIRERRYGPQMAAVCGFLLGRAVGKREERQRRRAVTP